MAVFYKCDLDISTDEKTTFESWKKTWIFVYLLIDLESLTWFVLPSTVLISCVSFQSSNACFSSFYSIWLKLKVSSFYLLWRYFMNYYKVSSWFLLTIWSNVQWSKIISYTKDLYNYEWFFLWLLPDLLCLFPF